MIEFGKTLREAREAKGYTIGQVAESTRLMSSMIEDLEKEDFSRIAAPIYGRGFVKLYCEAVGLDPKPLVAEFMDIFSGNRDIAIKERPVETAAPHASAEARPAVAPAPEPAAEPAPMPPPPPVAAAPAPKRQPPPADSLFDFAAPPVAPTAVPPAAKPVPAPAPEPPAEAPRLPRYSAPLETGAPNRTPAHVRSPSLPHIPPVVWRLGTLILGALLVIWLLLIGVRALYRATTGSNHPAPVAPTAEAPRPAAKPTAKPTARQTPQPSVKVKRTPQKIPPLYMD